MTEVKAGMPIIEAVKKYYSHKAYFYNEATYAERRLIKAVAIEVRESKKNRQSTALLVPMTVDFMRELRETCIRLNTEPNDLVMNLLRQAIIKNRL